MATLPRLVFSATTNWVATGPTEIANYDFPEGTFGTISATYWTQIDGDSIYKSDAGDWVVCGTSADSAAVWAGAGTFNADQYSETAVADAGSPVSFLRPGPAVRCTTNNYYMAGVDAINDRAYLWRVNSGTATSITDVAVTWNSGDKLRLEVSGTGSATRLVVKRSNGSAWSTVISSSDPGGTYLDTGKPGIYGGAWATAQPGISSWAGGNL
jgi:hypothetical protein